MEIKRDGSRSFSRLSFLLQVSVTRQTLIETRKKIAHTPEIKIQNIWHI